VNILVPLNDFEHLKMLYDAGAREFYMGFYDPVWDEVYGKYGDLNRLSGYGHAANQYSLKELERHLSDLSKKPIFTEIAIYITFNAASYSASQLEKIREYFRILRGLNVKGVIISNLELTMIAKEEGIDSVISTIAVVYNADTVRVYQRHGAKRVILPRDMGLEEIREIIMQVPDMEYEVFLMRNGCSFSDSNCLGFHRTEKCSICASLAGASMEYPQIKDFRKEHDFLMNHDLYSNYFHEEACGLCAIYQFLAMNVTAVKIVGRSEDYRAICNDIGLVSKNIRLAADALNESDYLKSMIFPEQKDKICRLGLSCYYPEVRFPKE